MGYYLQAFIGKPADLKMIAGAYSKAKVIVLGQDTGLIPLTEGLFDQINDSEPGAHVRSFEYLTARIEKRITEITQGRPIAYIEADYFGGTGGQAGLIWTNGKRTSDIMKGLDVINAVLRHFGVLAENGKDEFDTLGFGRHRNTADWVE